MSQMWWLFFYAAIHALQFVLYITIKKRNEHLNDCANKAYFNMAKIFLNKKNLYIIISRKRKFQHFKS